MDKELKALNNNNTCTLVELPKGKKTLGSKRVFTTKNLLDGILKDIKHNL